MTGGSNPAVLKGDEEMGMNWKRILMGKLSFHYEPCHRWFSLNIDRYWSGRLIYLSISRFTLAIDCRINWVEDVVTGKAK